MVTLERSIAAGFAAGAVIVLAWMGPAGARAQELSTRELERINWMEFREAVPARVETVLVPLGTLEPHGVTANGADIIAPVAIARAIAPRVNAMIAPVIPYGITGSMDAYPGAFTVPEEAYRPYVKAVLLGLAKNRFRNIILINGHGGPQTAVLNALGVEVGREASVRTLVVNWWAYCADVTLDVFGEDGGHAGENENAFMLAIDPSLVHQSRYSGPEMATANPAPNTWSAYPSPSSIGLYREGQGFPRFDAPRAKRYFAAVNDKMARLIEDTIRKWNMIER
ncbi:MAG TPA: creatininase family protein [Vicinamibacterales bacterium]|nr:creatininase family protein [Vicinamibacterales bacterium]